METRQLRQQIVAMRQSFFDEEILDEQFCQLEQLEENGNPSFLEQVFTMYFNDSTTVLATVEQAMRGIESIDLGEVDHVLHKFKGSSASVGANKVRNQIINTRKLVAEGDLEGAEVAFQELRKEYDNLKAKLEHYFQQLKQAGPAAAGDCSASQVK